ncbi:MAG: hypothetical protein ACLFNT_09815 [Spirochaetales bacterium]
MRRITLFALLTSWALVLGCATDGSAAAASEGRASASQSEPFPQGLDLPERNEAWPGPETFRIGNAVSPVNYWMTAWMFNDVFRQAGFEAEIGDTRPSELWIPVVDWQWFIEDRHLVLTDELGWPRSMTLEDGRRASQLATIVVNGVDIEGAYPAGIYRLTYEGSGSFAVDGGEIVSERPGEVEIEYGGSNLLIVYVTQTDPEQTGDYIRNIELRRPDATEEGWFLPEYIEYLKPYSVIRPLHFFGDQLTYGPEVDWEDRKPVEYSHWGGALGAPYEVAIALANESVSDLWVNIPVAADDTYVRELARLLLDQLDSNRKVYIEYGNELWNFTFPYQIAREYVLEVAQERWPGVYEAVQPYSDGDPVNEVMMINSYQGARTVEIAEIFRDVWSAHRDRLIIVAAGQLGASHPYYFPSRYLLGCPVYVGEEGGPECGTQVDAFAIAGYVGEAEGEIEFDRSSPEAFFTDAIDFVRGEGEWGPNSEEPGMRYLFRLDKALADEYGLPLIAYEGGQHFIGSRYTRDVINRHPMMRELYDALFDVWQEEGGGLFVHLSGIIPPGQSEPGEEPSYFQSENFGIKETQSQTRVEAPKWDAVLETMEEIDQL